MSWQYNIPMCLVTAEYHAMGHGGGGVLPDNIIYFVDPKLKNSKMQRSTLSSTFYMLILSLCKHVNRAVKLVGVYQQLKSRHNFKEKSGTMNLRLHAWTTYTEHPKGIAAISENIISLVKNGVGERDLLIRAGDEVWKVINYILMNGGVIRKVPPQVPAPPTHVLVGSPLLIAAYALIIK